MKRESDNNLRGGLTARPQVLIAGLAACFSLSALPAASFAQRAVRFPATPGAEAVAQQRTLQIEGLMVTYLPNRSDARLSDIGSSTYRRGYWMKIMIQFASQPEWIDEARFDCYVLVGDNTVLTGSVTCTYVRAGRGHLVALYVPPNVLERYGGRPARAAVECYHQNSLVSDYTIPRTTRRWWQGNIGVPGTMLNWFHTPFLRDGIERYEQVRTGG